MLLFTKILNMKSQKFSHKGNGWHSEGPLPLRLVVVIGNSTAPQG